MLTKSNNVWNTSQYTSVVHMTDIILYEAIIEFISISLLHVLNVTISYEINLKDHKKIRCPINGNM